MIQKNTRRYGSLWNALGSTMYGFNSFLLLTSVNRFLGVEMSGVFGIAFTTSQLLQLVGVFGVGQFQMTDYHEQFSYRVYAKTRVITNVFMGACALLACFALSFSKEKTLLTLLLTAYMMAHSVSELFESRFFQLNRLDLSGKCLFFRTLFSLACFVAALWATKNLYASTAVLALANITAIFLFSYFPCRKFLPSPSPVAKSEVVSLLKTSLPLFISLFLMNFLMQLPKYAIEKQCTDEIQGIFNMIFMPAQVINLVSSFVYRPMLKSLSDSVTQRDFRKSAYLIGRQLAIIFLFTLVACIGSEICGVEVLGLLYGADLSGQSTPLLFVVIGGGLFAVCQLIYYIVLILRKQMLIFYNYTACLIISFFICPLLVRKSGITGAAASFALMQLIIIVIYCLIGFVEFLRSGRKCVGEWCCNEGKN